MERFNDEKREFDAKDLKSMGDSFRKFDIIKKKRGTFESKPQLKALMMRMLPVVPIDVRAVSSNPKAISKQDCDLSIDNSSNWYCKVENSQDSESEH